MMKRFLIGISITCQLRRLRSLPSTVFCKQNIGNEGPDWRNQPLYQKSNDGTKDNIVQYYYDKTGNIARMYTGQESLLTITGLNDVSGSTDYAVTKYEYDTMGRVTSITDPELNTQTNVYDIKGTVQQTTDKNNQVVNYTYNALNQPKRMYTVGENNTEVDPIEYNYYITGLRKNMISNGIGRLSSETANGKTVSYDFTTHGNRNTKTENVGGTETKTRHGYNKNNHLLNTSDGTNETTYTYDNNGNQYFKLNAKIKDADGPEEVSVEEGLGGAVTTFDAYNRLVKVQNGNDIIEYTYNGDGLRTSQTVNGVKTDYVLDGMFVVLEITEGQITRYIRGLSLIKREKNNTTTYYAHNTHGDVTQLVDKDGNTIKTYEYDAFGNELGLDNRPDDDNPFRYCSEYYDKETGFIYLRARYYDTTIGRFISEDPIRDGLNWYSYSDGDPVNRWDPSGLYWLEKDSDGQVYAVIEPGDTLSEISYSQVNDSSAYLKLGYAEPGNLEVGQRVNITEIYNNDYPVPTNIALSKTSHTQGDSGLTDVSDSEVARRARDKSLSGNERRRYQKEEKLRGNRNKQKRQSLYKVNIYTINKPSLNRMPLAPEGKSISVDANMVYTAGAIAVGAYVAYLGVKWTVAAIFATPTGGATLVLAGATP